MTESDNTCTYRQEDSVIDTPPSFITPQKKKRGKSMKRDSIDFENGEVSTLFRNILLPTEKHKFKPKNQNKPKIFLYLLRQIENLS